MVQLGLQPLSHCMKSSASKQGQGERCCPNTSAHHTHDVNNGDHQSSGVDLTNRHCRKMQTNPFLPLVHDCCTPYRIKQNNNKCVSKTDTNPPFAFQIAFPQGTDFTGFLQGRSKSRDLQSEISVRIESRIESADSRLQLQC